VNAVFFGPDEIGYLQDIEICGNKSK